MSVTIFESYKAAEKIMASGKTVPALDIAPPKGLGFFRGLMLTIPLGAGLWAGIYNLVRAFT